MMSQYHDTQNISWHFLSKSSLWMIGLANNMSQYFLPAQMNAYTTEKEYNYCWASTSPGLGLGLRPGLPLILGAVSSGFVPASLLSLLHLRMRLLEQLATSRAGDGSAPGQRSTQPAGFRVYTQKKHICFSSSLFPATLQPLSGLFWKSLRVLSVSVLQFSLPHTTTW